MNLNHQNFITEYLRHRSPFTAYCLAYNLKDCSNYDSIMSAANRLINNEEVGGTIRSILDNIRHEVEQEVRAEMKQELLTIQRKRELLASIATGEMVAVQLYKGKDCNACTQMVRPTITQMLRAIDLDSKLAGHYPIHSRQLTVGQQNTTNGKASHNVSPRNISRDGREGDRGTSVLDTPETNTPIGNKTQQSEKTNTPNGNNGVALKETDENYPERIKTQQIEKIDNPNGNKSQQTEIKNTIPPSLDNKNTLSLPNCHIAELPNRPISHAGLRKLLASKHQSPL